MSAERTVIMYVSIKAKTQMKQIERTPKLVFRHLHQLVIPVISSGLRHRQPDTCAARWALRRLSRQQVSRFRHHVTGMHTYRSRRCRRRGLASRQSSFRILHAAERSLTSRAWNSMSYGVKLRMRKVQIYISAAFRSRSAKRCQAK